MNTKLFSSERGKHTLAITFLFLLCVLCFSSTIRYGFVYDDQKQIVESQQYFTDVGWIPEYFRYPIGASYYRPLFMCWFLLNSKLFGLNPAGWHASTVLVHASAVVFSYIAAFMLTKRRSFAVIAAAIFAVHPAHVESVAWVSGVTDPMLALFTFGSFCCYLKGRESRKAFWWTLSALLALGAMLSKEVGVAIPPLIALHTLIFSSAKFSARLRASVLAAMPSGICAVLYLLARHKVLAGLGPNIGAFDTMVLTWPKAVLFYVQHLVWPTNLSMFYEFPLEQALTFKGFALPLLIIVGLLAALVLLYRRQPNPLVLFAVLWIFITLAPALYLRAFTADALVHDRYLYLPSFGLALLVVIALEALPAIGQLIFGLKSTAVAASGIVIMLLFLSSLAEQPYYKDDLTLFYRASQSAPSNFFAWMNLGVELAARGRFDEAYYAYQRALKIDDRSWLLHDNLGLLHLNTGHFEEAERELTVSVQGNPRFAKTQMHFALLRMQQNRVKEARDFAEKALVLDPRNAEFHYIAAYIYSRLGDKDAERSELQRTLTLDPQHRRARERWIALFPEKAGFGTSN